MKIAEKDVKETYPDINLKKGEWMLACRWCGYRGEKNYAAASRCPICKSNLYILSESEN